jgi:hypothetical protein
MAKTGPGSIPNPVGRKGMNTQLLFSRISFGLQVA